MNGSPISPTLAHWAPAPVASPEPRRHPEPEDPTLTLSPGIWWFTLEDASGAIAARVPTRGSVGRLRGGLDGALIFERDLGRVRDVIAGDELEAIDIQSVPGRRRLGRSNEEVTIHIRLRDGQGLLSLRTSPELWPAADQ